MDGLRRAMGFLTIYPLHASDTWTPETLGSSMVYYPVVGLLIGLALWMLHLMLSTLFPSIVAIVLLLGGLTFMTGGLHLDGLADTIDGLSGGYSREETLNIFKDSHVGTMAVISVALTLLLKYACLSVLPEEAMFSSLVLMGVLSRYSMVQLACFSPYARPEGGLGEPFVQGVKPEHFSNTVLITLGITMVFGRARGILIWMLVGLATLSYQTYFRRRLHGITGDVLGAVNEANEALVLVLATMVF